MRHLHTRFILAGCLLVMATVATGLWAAMTFARLSTAAGDALSASRERIDQTAGLADSLEREDDALLLALGGETERAHRELTAERRRGDRFYAQLVQALPAGGEGQDRARRLRDDVDRYRAAGSELLAAAGQADALERYHRQVNPLLRRAVDDCQRLREQTFESLRRAGVHARDDAQRATWIVVGWSIAAVVVALVVSTWLARSVVPRVRELTASVEALRQGDFTRRVHSTGGDELSRLAEGFNRLAETLAEYRASSLGELLAAKTTLETTLNALPDAVLVVAPDGSLAALNPQARAVLEAKGVAKARHLRQLPLRPEHQAAVAEALAGKTSASSHADFALTLDAHLDGVLRRFHLMAVPVPEFAPRRCGAVIVLADVTAFARLDELRAELIAVASHELKTPLTTLRMILRLLSEEADNLTSRQREMLEAALGGCEELAGTIAELLDVTQIEAGQLRLDLVPVDLTAAVAQALQVLHPRFDDARVRVQVRCDCVSAVVRGDAARLRTVLVNLLTNALKYSPMEGTVTVRLSSAPCADYDGAAAVQVAVIDAGPGVPAEFRERIFEKFFRVEHHFGGDREVVRGTGIGLYLCREIIKAHGGSIYCQPGEGGLGTQVTFSLPAAPPD